MPMPVRLIPAAALFCLAAAGCRPEVSAGAPSLAPSTTPAHAPVMVRLADVAAAAGVRFQHEYGRLRPLPIVETMGSGAAFLDYDADGRPDLFLVNSGQDFHKGRQQPGSKLFHNDGGRFTDVTREAGIAIDSYAMGCCTGDYDND